MNHENQSRLLDMIKAVALLLVSWAHYVSVGTWAVEVPGILNGTLETPLLPAKEHSLYRLESFFFNRFGIQFGVIGVVLFFLVSGYLAPRMQIKYNRICLWGGDDCLLFSRMRRIYPTLFVCVFLNAILVASTQRIVYSWGDYLSTATVTVSITKSESTMGVLWYLMVLFFVYVLLTLVPRITLENLTMVYIFLFILVFLPKAVGDFEYAWLIANLQFVAKYSGIILLGAAGFLSKDCKWIRRGICLTWFFVLSFGLLVFARYLYGDESTYSLLNTYIAVFVIIVTLKALDSFAGKVVDRFQRLISFINRISLPFYLLHVHFGIITIYYFRKSGAGVVLSVFAAYTVSVIISLLVSLCVAKVTTNVSKQLHKFKQTGSS